MAETYSVNTEKLALLALVVPLTALILMLHRFVIPVPVEDDFASILEFTLGYKESASVTDKLGLLVSQHNEHRIVVLRVLTVLCLTFLQKLDFNFLFYCSCILLVGTFVTLIFTELEIKQSAIAAACGVPILFNMKIYLSLLYPTVAIPTLSSFIFGAASCILAFKPGRRSLLLGIGFLFITLFCQGNGAALGPAIAITLATRKEFRKAAFWLGASLISIFIYFINYHPVAQHPPLAASLLHINRNILYFLRFAGIAFSEANENTALVMGCIYILLLFGVYLKSWKVTPGWTAFSLFLLGGILLNTLARSEFGSNYVVYQHRYYLMSNTIWCLVISMLARVLLASNFRLTRVIELQLISLSYCLIMNISYAPFACHNYSVRMQQYRKWINSSEALPYHDPKAAAFLVNKALAAGILEMKDVSDSAVPQNCLFGV